MSPSRNKTGIIPGWMKRSRRKGLLFLKRRIERWGRRRPIEEEFYIDGAEAKIYCHLHRPHGEEILPGLLLVPWGGFPGTCFDSPSGIVNARDLASFGLCILHFDPQGRGKSRGREDYWGESHQEDMRRALEYLHSLPFVDRSRFGVASFSLGISIAAAGLASPSGKAAGDAAFLLDWEGPSNRFNITLNDTKRELAGRFPTSDTLFWEKREAVNFIGHIRCRYFRVQGEQDHVQGGSKGHAFELLNTATSGSALWTRCNDNPSNILYRPEREGEYHWLRPGTDHQWIISLYLLRLFDHDYDP